MKDYKTIQVQIEEPFRDIASKRDMPECIRQLQSEGYAIDSVAVSQPIIKSCEVYPTNRTDYSYRTLITYVLVKRV